jgi:hypothetical protein
MTDHSIKPPIGVVQLYWDFFNDGLDIHGQDGTKAAEYAAEKIAQWGADQELEACCEWIDTPAVFQTLVWNGKESDRLRAARRPKPPSLKEQAFAALQNSHVDPVDETLQLSADAELIIRRALENLND